MLGRGLRAARRRPGRDRLPARRHMVADQHHATSRRPAPAGARRPACWPRPAVRCGRPAFGPHAGVDLRRWLKAFRSGVGSSAEEREELHGRHATCCDRDARAVGAGRRAAAARAAAAREPSTGTSSTSPAAPTSGGGGLQQAGRRPLPDQLRQAADRRQPAARADRPPAGRQGRQHRPDRDGRDLDGRVRRGGLDPAVDGRSASSVAEQGKLEGPLKTVAVQGQGLGDPVHHQHPAALVPQGPGRQAARGLHLGRDDRRRGRATGRPSRSRRASTRG